MKRLDCSVRNVLRVCCAGAAVVVLVQPTRGLANDVEPDVDEPGFREVAAEYMADYFSDPRRTGSLAGGIIGGALTAHPIGPVIGGIIGFIMGKQSAFSEGGERVQRQTVQPLARRQIVPAASAASAVEPVATLSFGSLTPVSLAPSPTPQPAVSVSGAPLAAPHAVPPVATVPTVAGLHAPADVIATQAMVAPVLPQGAPIVPPDRLASLCVNGPLADPRVRALCYYGHSN